MADILKRLEDVTHRFCNKTFGVSIDDRYPPEHPFDERHIHATISTVSKKLFDDGHYRQATLDAFIRIEVLVKERSELENKGQAFVVI